MDNQHRRRGQGGPAYLYLYKINLAMLNFHLVQAAGVELHCDLLSMVGVESSCCSGRRDGYRLYNSGRYLFFRGVQTSNLILECMFRHSLTGMLAYPSPQSTKALRELTLKSGIFNSVGRILPN